MRKQLLVLTFVFGFCLSFNANICSASEINPDGYYVDEDPGYVNRFGSLNDLTNTSEKKYKHDHWKHQSSDNKSTDNKDRYRHRYERNSSDVDKKDGYRHHKRHDYEKRHDNDRYHRRDNGDNQRHERKYEHRNHRDTKDRVTTGIDQRASTEQ